jgi:triphosphoribosyl-dephospho-CoA synthase
VVILLSSQIVDQLWKIAEKGQFAVFLDIITPKPGNVNRYHDHPDTRLVHFGASITRLASPLYSAATAGYEQTVHLGELIKTTVQRTMGPHNKNTLLGTILLLIPLAAAAGSCLHTKFISQHQLQIKLKELLNNTTVEDAIEVIRALQIANPGGAVPKSPEWKAEQQALNFQSPRTLQLIRKEGYTLLTLQKLAATYDAVAKEYATNFAYIFDELYPQYVKALNHYPQIEDAVLATFMWALSHRPDTFILRKAGSETANKIRLQAQEFYKRLLRTPSRQWQTLLHPFDNHLRSQGSQLNPGTTADLLSGAIFIALLSGDVTLIL